MLLITGDLEEVRASERVMLDRRGQKVATPVPEQLRGEYARHLRLVAQWLRQQPNVAALILSYHEILAEPQAACECIQSFLGTSLDLAAMTAVVDRGLHRQKLDGK